MDIFLYPIDIDLMLCIFAFPQCRLILIFRIEKRGFQRIVCSGQFLLRFPPFLLGVFPRKSGGNLLLLFLRRIRNALYLLRVFLLIPRRLCIFILFYFLLKSIGKRIHPLYRLSFINLYYYFYIGRSLFQTEVYTSRLKQVGLSACIFLVLLHNLAALLLTSKAAVALPQH